MRATDRGKTEAHRLRAREGRWALARRAARLQRLIQAGHRIQSASSVAGVAGAAAAEARSLFGAREARVTVDAREGHPAITRASTRSGAAGSCGAREVTVVGALNDVHGRRLGALTLVGEWPRRTDEALVAQFADTVAGALSSAWLLRAASEATRTRDDVLAMVSHDLRSPLATVWMGAAMLRKSLAETGPDDDVEVVQRMARACQRMSRLLDDLLDAARMDTGTFAVAPRPLAAAALVLEAVDAASVAAATGRVRLRTLALEPVRVKADRDRVLQLFSNLLGNALKFTPPGGEITVSAEEADGCGRFTVTDTGPGIPAEHIPRLFDRFWRRESGSPTAQGLGLYISRGIVDAHLGRLDVRSEPGRGSAFVFTLPLAQ